MTSPASTCKMEKQRGAFSRQITGPRCPFYDSIDNGRKPIDFPSAWLALLLLFACWAVGTCKLFLIFFSMEMRKIAGAVGRRVGEQHEITTWDDIGALFTCWRTNTSWRAFRCPYPGLSGTWGNQPSPPACRPELIDYSINMLALGILGLDTQRRASLDSWRMHAHKKLKLLLYYYCIISYVSPWPSWLGCVGYY